jgi:nucleotide-binding universal stress UspA family protein
MYCRKVIKVLKKILVPLDGSEQAERALDFALEIAQSQRADVTAFVVNKSIPSTLQSYLKYAHITDAIHTVNESLTREIFKKVKEKATSKDINISTISAPGYPDREILNYSKDFDLLVIAKDQLGKVDQFLFCRLTDKVAYDALCPVTIVN